MLPKRFSGWHGKLRGETLPLAVALQALGWVLLTFFLAFPRSGPDNAASLSASASLEEHASTRWLTPNPIPADLLRERLPLPRLTSPVEPSPRPDIAVPDESHEQTQKSPPVLDAFRVDTVTLEAPSVSPVAAVLPSPPDQLVPGSISAEAFGDGEGRPGRVGPGGWGGYGPGEMGDGPRCHPKRPDALRNPRNPISGLSSIIRY